MSKEDEIFINSILNDNRQLQQEDQQNLEHSGCQQYCHWDILNQFEKQTNTQVRKQSYDQQMAIHTLPQAHKKFPKICKNVQEADQVEELSPKNEEMDANSHYFGLSQLSNHSWFQPELEISQQILPQVINRLEQPKQRDEKDVDSSNSPNRILKNQTKNIPKNYGKAIITFIQKQKQIVSDFLAKYNLSYEEFLNDIQPHKKSINTIANLRQLWINSKYAECFRMITNQFLRKHALNYIFNSRISNYKTHVKYRKRLQEAVETPSEFKHIKQY